VVCESRLEHGTSFEIELPGLPGSAAASETSAATAATPSGTETIFIIDDEALVRRATRAMLEHGGYRVLDCGDGEQALAIFEQKRAAIDLVVLDRSMPGLSGEQVFVRLKQLANDIPIVLMSGQLGVSAVTARAAAAITKPISIDMLLGTVRRVLDRKLA
jgi:DNA-binding NtrC family response regulator